MKINCLSVRQPYASAILDGLKVEEYRSRKTNHRGLLAIHASMTLEPTGLENYDYIPETLTFGAILGVVEVVDCVECESGFAWQLANPLWLDTPIPFKGKVGLFPVDIDNALIPQAAH